MKIYRVQDAEGRGPFRPGVPRLWIDNSDQQIPPADWITEFGTDFMRSRDPKRWIGCGVRDLTTLNRWFTATEMKRLRELGYTLVAMHADRILAESENQVVFERDLPFTRGATVMRFPDERRS